MKRFIGSVVFVFGALGIGMHMSSRSCGACPPVVWETERAVLSIESMTVDGVPVEIPGTYGEAEVSLRPSPVGPEDLWLEAEVDSTSYLAVFR